MTFRYGLRGDGYHLVKCRMDLCIKNMNNKQCLKGNNQKYDCLLSIALL